MTAKAPARPLLVTLPLLMLLTSLGGCPRPGPHTIPAYVRRCERESRKAHRAAQRARRQLAEVNRALRRATDLLASSQARHRRNASAVGAERKRLNWFRHRLCRRSAISRQQVEFNARLLELKVEKLEKRYAATRNAYLRKRQKPALDKAIAARDVATKTRRELRDLTRRCRLYDAAAALKPTAPPPPAPATRSGGGAAPVPGSSAPPPPAP